MSRKKRMRVVEFDSITHQGKVLKMSGEVGAVWRPKTRLKNNIKLNMKKLLNPKLAEKKVIIMKIHHLRRNWEIVKMITKKL